VRISIRGEYDKGDWRHISLLESEGRRLMHEFVAFLRERVPGFAGAYLICEAPFLGSRGGAHIESGHVLTVEESIAGARFDDVIFVNIHEAVHGGAKEGYDVPYRMLLPKGLDGLLVTGRGAGYIRRGHDPSGIRARPSMMILGQATGVAAALAAKGTSPRKLDMRLLQRTLVQQGLCLGDKGRLEELGLTV
jgi:hypothetical protein